jgi:hypothetical protein
MYHDLMDLYGDWANTAALERELTARGCEVTLEKKSVGDDIDLHAYDFIFIGSGTERSLIACMRDLARYKDILLKRIDEGVSLLATGNAHELFGNAVTDYHANRHEMLGLLDFETKQIHTRVTGDCVCRATFLENKLIGFINRAGGGQEGDIKRPFFVEPGEGASYKAHAEGIQYKNLLGTYMTGPVLVRNPPLLSYLADRYAPRVSSEDMFFKYQQRAYSTTLSKLL